MHIMVSHEWTHKQQALYMIPESQIKESFEELKKLYSHYIKSYDLKYLSDDELKKFKILMRVMPNSKLSDIAKCAAIEWFSQEKGINLTLSQGQFAKTENDDLSTGDMKIPEERDEVIVQYEKIFDSTKIPEDHVMVSLEISIGEADLLLLNLDKGDSTQPSGFLSLKNDKINLKFKQCKQFTDVKLSIGNYNGVFKDYSNKVEDNILKTYLLTDNNILNFNYRFTVACDIINLNHGKVEILFNKDFLKLIQTIIRPMNKTEQALQMAQDAADNKTKEI